MKVTSVETLAEICTQHDSKRGENPDLMVLAIVNSMMTIWYCFVIQYVTCA